MTETDKSDIGMTWQQHQMIMMNNGCGTPFYAVIIIAIVLILSSCATKTKIEYRDRLVDNYITKEVHDTLRENTTDSVYFEVVVKGDTVYQTKYKEKTKWRDRVVERRDTCWRDSVVTEYKETTKEIVKYPKTYWWFLGISLISVIFAIIKIIRYIQIH